MSNVTGVVTEVQNGKTFQGKMGTLKSQTVSIKSSTGTEVKVQRSVKPENDGQNLLGKSVQVDYTEETINGKNGTFTVNKTDSKRFAVLDENGQAPKSFQKGGYSSGGGSTTVTVGTSMKPSYNSEGARHGMIVNNAVLLASHRKDSSLEGLKQAASDITTLTKFVEEGAVFTATKTVNKAKVVTMGSNDSPFDDE